ncbi:hypothetical protein [Nocardioides sp.]|jgi:hypothetical protein|uniref:hypothetical protein n=1 Tax=Nocardioides sp. TaxID=35761 RepID=UPI002BD8FE68|nr:hypothetical protein [Nocardioides sp.]HVX54154.1 hypothetical protein [Nocardioides sp.]
MRLIRSLACGALAGAAGTTALNAATYLDMAIRGRGSSSTPERTVETMAARAGVGIPGDEETAQNRVAGLGPMLGIAAGIGTGAALGVLHAAWRPPLPVGAVLATAGAMAASDAPMAAMGVTDPTSWSPADWAADALPHGVYGVVTAATLRLLT